MKRSEVLREALALLGPNGEHWGKGAFFQDVNGRSLSLLEGEATIHKLCGLGAVHLVCDRRNDTTELWFASAAHALHAAAGTLGHTNLHGEGWFPNLNDAVYTTFEDVRLAFKHAIAEAEAGE